MQVVPIRTPPRFSGNIIYYTSALLLLVGTNFVNRKQFMNTFTDITWVKADEAAEGRDVEVGAFLVRRALRCSRFGGQASGAQGKATIEAVHTWQTLLHRGHPIEAIPFETPF